MNPFSLLSFFGFIVYVQIVSDILDLAKIEAGKLDVSHASFDLRATVADALTTVQPIAAKNRNALSAQVDDGLPAIVSDEVKVRQILVNLLSNACKFTKAGTVELRVVRDPELSAVRISVTDTGIGMTPQELERVFLPFTQGDGSSTRKFGGTGLGLTITSRLCERLGAQIAVSSYLAGDRRSKCVCRSRRAEAHVPQLGQRASTSSPLRATTLPCKTSGSASKSSCAGWVRPAASARRQAKTPSWLPRPCSASSCRRTCGPRSPSTTATQ